MKFSSTETAATSRLFSSAIFKEMARNGRSATFARVAREVEGLRDMRGSELVGDAFDRAFSALKAIGCRDEYIYKAALTQKILLGRHNLRTASMLTEFRVATCKADLVILNGTATAYEIKSERDSLTRLSEQLAAYRKAFARVFVICSEKHATKVSDVAPWDVGILSLSRRNQISEVRSAQVLPERVCPVTILDSLRSQEAIELLRSLGHEIPAVSNTKLRQALRVEFERLEPERAHHAMVEVLKRTRNLSPLSDLVSGLPSSLSAAALSYPIRRQDHDKVVKAVHTTLEDAWSWA